MKMIMRTLTGESITPSLIRYMANARSAAIPAEVRAKAKHHILDTVAAMVSGTTIKPGQFALRWIEQQGGTPEAQVIGSGILTSAINAAIASHRGGRTTASPR